MTTQVSTVWPIGRLLQWTTDFFTRHDIDEPRLSAELLLAHVLGLSRMALYTQFDHVPAAQQIEAFRALVQQRRAHTPVAYLIHKNWFFSMEFSVSPAVLIPRPDTETLVETAIRTLRLATDWPKPDILDMGCGSGCIAIALAQHLPEARIVATDISDAAISIAKANARSLGVMDRIRLIQGDLFEALREIPVPPRFHLIASNPPYIPTGQLSTLMPEVRDHEPRLALDGGEDGLTFYRKIIAVAPDHLAPNGILLLEHAFDQAAAVSEIIRAIGRFSPPRLIRDAAGNPRCVMANLM